MVFGKYSVMAGAVLATPLLALPLLPTEGNGRQLPGRDATPATQVADRTDTAGSTRDTAPRDAAGLPRVSTERTVTVVSAVRR